eukprot:TRINITY_DN10757_c0_g1_i2.p2 TRINITY_DN10757_c0_g1~~TRINITY_DN10757_c0_g1_i2.p2  ORF type:complete len:108 (-),score=1.09 TRINITY_DN10757_c0_g1_i2:363-686(-)
MSSLMTPQDPWCSLISTHSISKMHYQLEQIPSPFAKQKKFSYPQLEDQGNRVKKRACRQLYTKESEFINTQKHVPILARQVQAVAGCQEVDQDMLCCTRDSKCGTSS